LSETAARYRLPPPQIDYETGAKNGMTLIRYVNSQSGQPENLIFFNTLEQCQVGVRRMNAYVANKEKNN
jgi:hypothetical protein